MKIILRSLLIMFVVSILAACSSGGGDTGGSGPIVSSCTDTTTYNGTEPLYTDPSGTALTLNWTYSACTPSSVDFELVGTNITGYMGIGFSGNGMHAPQSDMIIGWVDGNCPAGCVYDYTSTSHGTPTPDAENNVTLLSGSESAGSTTISFRRDLDTGDPNDAVLSSSGTTTLLWAFNLATDPTSSTSMSVHTARGVAPIIIKSKGTFSGTKPLDNNLTLNWAYSPARSYVDFELVGTGITGYLALGFNAAGLGHDPTNSTDIIIGWVDGGSCTAGCVYDYTSTSYSIPTLDPSNDVTLLSASESGGSTTVKFRRELNTGDPADAVLSSSGTTTIVWAYQLTTDPTSSSNMSQHGGSARGADSIVIYP